MPPSEDVGGKKPRVFKTYLRLLRYVKPYWKQVVFVLILSVALSLMSVLPIQLFGVLIDTFRESFGDALQQKPAMMMVKSKLPIDAPIRSAADYAWKNWFPHVRRGVVMLAVIAATSILFALINGVLGIAHGYTMAKVGQRVVYDMRNEVYEHLQRLSIGYFTDRPTGDLMSRVVNDVASLNAVIAAPIVDFLRDFCRFGWILYFCLSWDYKLTLIGFVVAPALLVSTFIFGRYIRRAFRDLRRKVGELNALLQENISGIRVIKGFSREGHELKRFEAKNYENFLQHMRVTRLFAVFRPMIDLLNHVGTVAIVCYGGYKVIYGYMSPGTFLVFLPYLQMLYGPIRGLSRFYNLIQQAVASVERVFEVLDTAPVVQDAPDAIELDEIVGRVEFRNVSFSYDGGAEVLKDINLVAEPGQMIAFVGPSGAGKTTMINLILRFYDPTRGAILLDGHDIRKIKLKSLRSKMAMVLQEPFLFNDTIRNNIAYGKLDATDEEIIAAAKAANAHDFIVALPDGYDTVIGERGVRLSGGQKQRISIARAVLANPKILILDEATSSVDTETEILIQNAIYRLVKNRTTFVIAHRLSTILNADKIVVLDEGRILDEGTHQELLAKCSLYKKFFDLQFRTEEDVMREAVPSTQPEAGAELDFSTEEQEEEPPPLVL